MQATPPKVRFKANPTVKLDPPSPPQDDVLINKTGSTNGLSTHAAFVPARKIGGVMLANKRCPIDARVMLTQERLTRLAEHAPLNARFIKGLENWLASRRAERYHPPVNRIFTRECIFLMNSSP